VSGEEKPKGVRVDPEEVLRATRADPLGVSAASWHERLVRIIDVLRSPGGCPWDLDQDERTLRPFVLEEAYEVADAIARGESDGLREELGDLLLQVVLLSRFAKEKGEFTVEDVARGICEKLVRRHPHVFAGARAESAGDVVSRWERIKRQEKDEKGEVSILSGLPAALPALLKAYRIGQKAGRVGFDWDTVEGVLDKVEEELGELRRELAQGRSAQAREELGDLLFALAQLGRKMGADPEEALQAANEKFLRRFRALEARLRASGRAWEQVTLDELEAIWQEVKKG